MRNRIPPLLAAMAVLVTVAAEASPVTTGADFLLMTTGARPAGMGQAFSAVADDINSLTFNPAGLGNVRLPEIGYEHEVFFGDIGFDFLGAAVPIGEAGVLGLGYLGTGTGPFNSTASSSAPTASVQDTALIAAWGRSFYNVHVGAAVKYIMEDVDNVHGSGFAFDLGARYRILPELTVAGSVLNLGPGIQFATVEPLPLEVNGGLAWTPVEGATHTLTVASEAAYGPATGSVRLGLGAEYWYQNKFALRAGYLGNSSDEGFTAGAGIRFSLFQLDYAFEPYNNLGLVHRFSGIFRWDGPWVPGVEPNPPTNLGTEQNFQNLQIWWDKAKGPVDSYEVMIQPMDGGSLFVTAPVTETSIAFKNFKPDTLYRVSVRSIGAGGVKSFPSREKLVFTASKEAVYESMVKEDRSSPAQKASVFKGLNGKIDGIGVQFSWAESNERNVLGYNLYRRSPDGQLEKVTLEPRQRSRVWVTGVTELWGWEWMVTAVKRDGTEKTVGTCQWYPTQEEMAPLSQPATRRLSAVPQTNREVFLSWTGDSDVASYILLFSKRADGVYEFFKEINREETNQLMGIPGTQSDVGFIIVPRRSTGSWGEPTQEAKVKLYMNAP